VSSVGGTLRRLRLESGISLRVLARRLGVSSAYLSRVEHGLDPTPTPERLEALAAELDLPPGLLLEVAHRMSPLVERYVEQEPQAAALFIAIAGRALDAEELAEVRRFIERRFPRAGAAKSPNVALAPLLGVDRVVLGVECDDLADACEIGATRLVGLEHMPDVNTLTAAFVARAAEVEPGLGGGVAAIAASFPGARSAAVLVVLARPIEVTGGDGVSISVIVLLISSSRGREVLLRIAHVARLGTRGLVTALSSVRHPEQALQRLASLELVD
jgi:nitrogen PTS system EIIA component